MNILSLNPGSSSLKVGLFGDEPLYRGSFGAKEITEAISAASEHGSIDAIACRVVHGADRFSTATPVDDSVVSQIEGLAALAPLHNASDVAAIRAAREALPHAPIYAIFDTAFHRTLPAIATTYAIPKDLAEAHGLRRYGFHGISYRYVSERLSGCPRLVVCHLGSGASVCAIRNGVSIDTSMGFTPLEGLAMGTRSGDLDAGLVLYLLRELGMTVDQVEDVLNHHSGLLGISGVSADIRELVASSKESARLALDIFCYRVAKYVGAYAAVLGGIDGLAFTGGIGEHSEQVRSMVCERLGFLNIRLSKISSPDGVRNVATSSSLPVWVVPADEERQMANEVREAMRGNQVRR